MTGQEPQTGMMRVALHVTGAALGTLLAVVAAQLVADVSRVLSVPARKAVELRFYLTVLLPSVAAAVTVSFLAAAWHRPRQVPRSGFGRPVLANALLALALAAIVALPPTFEGSPKMQLRFVLGMYALVSLMASVRTAATLDKEAGAGGRGGPHP